MKKLIGKIFAAMLITLCALCFAACPASGTDGNGGGNGGESVRVDTAKNNKEFVAFRTKAVNVIKDSGIYVYDFDGQGSAQSSALNAAPGFAANASEIAELITADKNLTENTEGAKSMRDELFEQSLFSALYVGDGLTTYHKVERFYGIPVRVSEWAQYFTVTENNGVNTVMCYTPRIEENDFSQSEMYIYLKLDYKSKSDYYYEFVQYVVGEDDPRCLYAYGDSQKRFLGVETSTGKDHIIGEDEFGNPIYGKRTFIYYAPDDSVGYYTENYELATEIHNNYLAPYFTDIDTEEFEKMTSAEYTLTDEQLSELNKKYFGRDITLGPDENTGLQVADCGAEKIALYYVGGEDDNETEIVIPEGVTYIAKDFMIQSETGSIETLKIPASVKGVAEYYGEDSFAVCATAELDVRYDTLDDIKMLNGFTVASGSRAFRSGTGSLFAASGEIVYLADAPLTKFDLELFNERAMGYISYYKHLFDGLPQITLDLAADFETRKKYTEILQRVAPPSKINFIASADVPEYISLCLTSAGNITLDVNVKHSVRFDVVFDEGSRGNVTVNVHAFAGEDLAVIDYDGTIRYTVNVDCAEEIYNATLRRKILIGYGDDDARVTYNYGGVPLEPIDGFDAAIASQDEYVYAVVTLKDMPSGAEVTVPETYAGLPVTVLRLNVDKIGDKSVRINLNEHISQITLISNTPSDSTDFDGAYLGVIENENVVLVYGGTVEEYRDNPLYVMYGGMFFRLTVQCTNGTELLSDGNTSWNEQSHKLTFAVGDKLYERTVKNADIYESKLSLDFIDEIAELREMPEFEKWVRIESGSEENGDFAIYEFSSDCTVRLPYEFKDLDFTVNIIKKLNISFVFSDNPDSVIGTAEYDVSKYEIVFTFYEQDGVDILYYKDRRGNETAVCEIPQGKTLYYESMLPTQLTDYCEQAKENNGNITITIYLTDKM